MQNIDRDFFNKVHTTGSRGSSKGRRKAAIAHTDAHVQRCLSLGRVRNRSASRAMRMSTHTYTIR